MGQIIAINRIASLLNSDNVIPQLISDLHKSKDTTPNKEEKLSKFSTTALDAIKAYTPIGWAWSDTKIPQSLQTQTSARQTFSIMTLRHKSGADMDIDPDCSTNTHPCQTRPNNNPPPQPNERQKRNSFGAYWKFHFVTTYFSFATWWDCGTVNITTWLFLASKVKACNTIFMYDYQIHEVLDWQQVSKPKRNTNQMYSRIYLQPPRFCAGYSHRCKNTKTTH